MKIKRHFGDKVARNPAGKEDLFAGSIKVHGFFGYPADPQGLVGLGEQLVVPSACSVLLL